MVRVYLFEQDRYSKVLIPLFKSQLVSWEHFVKLYNAGVIRKVGKQYALVRTV